jgi:hypothetical protein
MKSKIYLDTSVISALFDHHTPERMSLTKSICDDNPYAEAYG